MSAKILSIELSGDTSVPMYRQIKNAILTKIKSGEWQPGQMIPSENQLAGELGASRMTINRPLRELTAEGWVKRVHGLGTFVAEPARQASLIEIRSIADEIEAQGKIHRAEVLSLESIKADEDIAERMAVVAGRALFQIKLVHYQDEVPIQFESRWVNPEKIPHFKEVDFTRITPTAYLISQVQPDDLEHVVEAVIPDETVAAHLAIPDNEPCLKLKRRTWQNNVIVTVVDLIYPSSRYHLGARYQPVD